MKELAEEFNKDTNDKETNYFNQLYNKHVLVFPWYYKKSLEWLIRSSNGSKVKLDAVFDRNISTKTTYQ